MRLSTFRTRVLTVALLATAAGAATQLLARAPLEPSRFPAPVGQDPAPVSEANRYGVVWDQFVPVSEAAVERARSAGFGWVTYTIHWFETNPAKDQYNWNRPDRDIAALAASGVNVFVRVANPPAWALGASYPNAASFFYCFDPANKDNGFVKTVPGTTTIDPDCTAEHIPTAADFEAFLRVAIPRYKDRVRTWGFGLEVHARYFWPADYTEFVNRILVTGYRTAKEIDPGLTIVGPEEDVMEMLADLLATESAVGRWCDVISTHLLSQTYWSFACPTGACPAYSSKYLEDALKAIVDKYGAGRPVWLTEFGAMSASTPEEESGQASWLAQQLELISHRPWIDKVFVYRLRNENDSVRDFGLLRADESPRPAFTQIAGFLATQSTPRRYYLAEGATGWFFDLDIVIANPNQAEAPVKITFLRQDGASFVVTPSNMPADWELPEFDLMSDGTAVRANSRMTIRVNALPGLDGGAPGTTSMSAIVESTTGAPLVVERTMFWNRTGHYGGHSATAVERPDTTWYFAEGSQGFFDTYLMLANANALPANVTITFLREWEDPVVCTRVVPARSRGTVYALDPDLATALVGRGFGITVESDQPIIAERGMYFGATPFWNGGHESAGVTAPSTNWFLAEGAGGSYFDTYITVSNPNDVTANVDFTYQLPTGETVRRIHTIPPQRRMNQLIEIEDDPLNPSEPKLADAAAVSTTIASDVPIIVERSMYWQGDWTQWKEAHDSFGLTETGTVWGLAEGRVGGAQGFDTFVLVTNPGSMPAELRVTILRTDGTTRVRTQTVPATSRWNLWVNHENDNAGSPLASNEEFGVIVESTNGVPIAVERAMYWSPPGDFWGGGTGATATKLR